MCNKSVYHLHDKPIRLDHFIQIDSLNNNYNFFSENLPCEVLNRNIDRNAKLIGNNEKEKEIVFKNLSSPSSTIYLLCNVLCDNNLKIVILPKYFLPAKLWINKKLISINNCWFIYPIVTELSKGNNIIIFELSNVYEENAFTARLSLYYYELSPTYESLIFGNLIYKNSAVKIIKELKNDKILFMISLDNTIEIDEKQNVVVLIRTRKILLKKFSCSFLKLYEFEIEKGLIKSDEELDNIIIECSYITNNSKLITIQEEVDYFDNRLACNKMLKQALKFKNSKYSTYFDKLWLDHYCKSIKENKNNSYEIWQNGKKLEAVLDDLCSDNHIEDMLYLPGSKIKYFFSELDESIEFYNIYIPNNYNVAKKYPLILYLSTSRYSWNSGVFDKDINIPVISADVSGRGVTMGSYIGEAAILEIINDICKCFSIDTERIYLTGTSNGAAASFALAQNYPHMFAGIYPISGRANLKNIKNLYNIYTIFATSKYEEFYNTVYKKLINRLKLINNYKTVFVEKMIHYELSSYLNCKIPFIKDMITHTLEQFPNEVFLYTERNRHNKSYWLEIHSIAFSKKYGKIHGKIVNDEILISCSNITGFTLTIPTNINRNYFCVTINGHKHLLINTRTATISFYKKKVGFEINDNPPNLDLSRKGTGLLDVYLGPLYIIVPNKKSSIFMNVAKAFSSPSTNGWDPVVYVKYPILAVDELNSTSNRKNLIVIDNFINNKFLLQIRQLLYVQFDEKGFTYKDNRYNCNYCIMQVIANPYDLKNSILYISTNYNKLLRRNLFTRKVIIPSYINRLHPYWNNEALILMNNKYFAIYEYGMDMVEL